VYSSAVFAGGRPLCTHILPGQGRSPSTRIGIRKLDTLGYLMVKTTSFCVPFFDTALECDRQTDGFAVAYTALVALPVSMENRIKLCVNICAVAVSGQSVQWGRNSGVDSTVPASAA